MAVKKNCIVVSDNDELCLSVKRAISFRCGLEVMKYEGKFGSRNNVVLLFEENNFESWLWGEFRSRKRALNPLILFGMEDQESFTKRNPVFKPYSDEHRYFRIPIDFDKLVSAIEEMEPIFDQVTRKLIVNNFAKEYEWKFITHDLKIVAGDKDFSIRNIKNTQDYYASIGDLKTVTFIKNGLASILPHSDWERCLLGIKEYLVRRYEDK